MDYERSRLKTGLPLLLEKEKEEEEDRLIDRCIDR